jgi:hypothetical protein
MELASSRGRDDCHGSAQRGRTQSDRRGEYGGSRQAGSPTAIRPHQTRLSSRAESADGAEGSRSGTWLPPVDTPTRPVVFAYTGGEGGLIDEPRLHDRFVQLRKTFEFTVVRNDSTEP